MSAELETLDQLLGGDLSLKVVRGFYPDDKAFVIAIHAMLRNGDVQLLSDGAEVPRWRWRELFESGPVTQELLQFKLTVTDQGASRVA